MPIYERYAPYYDGSGQLRFALLVAMYLRELLDRHPAPGRRLLDLACGTGTLALALAEQGWVATGLDLAPAMIDLARAKAAGLADPPRFLVGDMRAADGLLPAASFDLATCTYDSLNYLRSPAELGACFATAARALIPGGLFVGDLNTRHFLEHEWPACEVRELPGFVQIERSQFDPASAEAAMLLSGFAGDDEVGYERFDELHVERAYDPAEVDGLLQAAGLSVEAHYDSFTLTPPGPLSQRIFWVARKASASH